MQWKNISMDGKYTLLNSWLVDSSVTVIPVGGVHGIAKTLIE